jgi:hypothetical protein
MSKPRWTASTCAIPSTHTRTCVWRTRSNVSYAAPVLFPLPGMRPEQDLYLDPRQPFVPLASSDLNTAPRPHRNLSTLSVFTQGASSLGTHLVTDCTRANATRLQALLAGAPANVSLADAILAYNASTLTYVTCPLACRRGWSTGVDARAESGVGFKWGRGWGAPTAIANPTAHA